MPNLRTGQPETFYYFKRTGLQINVPLAVTTPNNQQAQAHFVFPAIVTYSIAPAEQMHAAQLHRLTQADVELRFAGYLAQQPNLAGAYLDDPRPDGQACSNLAWQCLEALQPYAADWGFEISLPFCREIRPARSVAEDDDQHEGDAQPDDLDGLTLALWGFPAVESSNSVRRLFENWLAGLGVFGGLIAAVAGLMVFKGHLSPSTSIYMTIMFASLTFVLWLAAGGYLRWSERRRLTTLRRSVQRADDRDGPPFSPHALPLAAAYQPRISFWLQIQRSVLAGVFHPPKQGRAMLERVIAGHRKRFASPIPASELDLFRRDLGRYRRNPLFTQMCLFVTATLIVQGLRKLAESPPSPNGDPLDPGLIEAREARAFDDLQRQIRSHQERLRRIVAFFRARGLEPSGLVPANLSKRGGIEGLWVQVGVYITTQPWAWWLRNRASGFAAVVASGLTPIVQLPRRMEPGATRAYWFLRNRLSDVAAVGTVSANFLLRHWGLPLAGCVVAGIVLWPGAQFASGPLHGILAQATKRLQDPVCTGAARLACPFTGQAAQRLCFWQHLGMCAGYTPQPAPPESRDPGVTTSIPDQPPATIASPASLALSVSAPDQGMAGDDVPPTVERNATPSPRPAVRPTGTKPAPAPRAPDCPDPRAVISQPALRTGVNGRVDILGTARHEDFSYFKLELGVGPIPPGWSFLCSSLSDSADAAGATCIKSQVQSGRLGVLDFGRLGLSPGIYSIRVSVVDRSGNFPPPCQTIVMVR